MSKQLSKKREKLIFGLVRWLYCVVCVLCTIKCIWTGYKTYTWYNCNLSEQEWRMQRSAFIHLLKGKEKKLKKYIILIFDVLKWLRANNFYILIFNNYLKNFIVRFFSLLLQKLCSSRGRKFRLNLTVSRFSI